MRTDRRALLLAAHATLLTASLAGIETKAADSRTGFELGATLADVPNYFPGYLGNGYVSTLTAPRGTEPTRAYLVGFMDYAHADMSRPASMPGWTEMDYSAGPSDSSAAWLNRAPLDEAHFQGYRQVLDMRGATLTTSYHYLDGGRATAIAVTTLVSEASPHLAATRLEITPDFDGEVRLTFPLLLWAEHAPRFELGRLSGPELEAAVAASGQTLEARAPATADREAVWYPGYTAILSAQGDSKARTLWIDGRADNGLPMAMAAAVDLPDDGIEAVNVVHDRYRLALDVVARVSRGRKYAFTKYMAVSRSEWGGDAAADVALAREARARGFERLLDEHRNAWQALWESDIEIDGDPRAQQLAHSELYYLLSSSTPDTAWAVGACGLTPGYAGHIFWDSDTWIFPALLLLAPERARSLVDFRSRTLDAARQRAVQHGFAGAMFPWEADPQNGTEQVPYSAAVLGDTEIHVNADVAIAQWQYFLASDDRAWLRERGWPVIRDVARFWTSRATYDARTHRYELLHVNSVAETSTDIPNDTFTSVSAAKSLSIATLAAKLLGERPDPRWQRIATGLMIPFDAQGGHHLPFDASVPGSSEAFGGGPLALLFLPSLDLDLAASVWRNDYAYAIRGNSPLKVGGTSMAIEPRVVAADVVGNAADVATWFATNLSGGTLKPPFNVRTEEAHNNTGYFLTGSGGTVQSLLFGLSGLRIRPQGLIEAYSPVLPASWTALKLHNLHFRGKRIDVDIVRGADGRARLTRRSSPAA